MMKGFIICLISFFVFVGCSNNKGDKELTTQEELRLLQEHKDYGSSQRKFMSADEYCETISGFTCRKAIVDEVGWLIVGIDATGGNYNRLAEQFLEEAQREGVMGLKGCGIVNYSTSEFQKGAVVGKRIGKAYN